MAILYNLARMTTATTGTGTITLGAAVSGYLTFAQAGASNLDIVEYAIADGSNSEIGTGTYTTSGTTLTRNVTKSTNSNAAISLSGTAQVFISPRAERLQIPRSHLAGLTLSTAGSSSTFGAAAGQATDGTNAEILSLASAVTKTTSAWAVGSGNGSLDTGTIANSTWYHAYLIYRPDTQIVDVLTSLSVSSPTLPTGYTLARRIGSMLTDAGGHWTAFTQIGDEFHWLADSVILNAFVPSVATAFLSTLTVPLGVPVLALTRWGVGGGASGQGVLVTSVDQTDVAVFSASNASASIFASTSGFASVELQTMTNTSAQIRWRPQTASVGAISLNVRGWIDHRGRDS